jgi:rod shape-determining protein MreC
MEARNKFLWAGVSCIALFFLILRYSPAGQFLRPVFLSVVSVVVEGAHRTLHFLPTWPSPSQLQHELLLENRKLKAQLAEQEGCRAESSILKKHLSWVTPKKERFIMAPVLTAPYWNQKRLFFVGAGKRQGVKLGQPVVSIYGIVGRVESVLENISRVMPLTHKDCHIPVVGTISRTQAILSGDGGDTPLLKHTKGTRQLKSEEKFVTSNYGGGFPAGIAVGELKKGKPGQPPRLKTFVPLSQLEAVKIFLDFPKLPSIPKGAG